MTTERMQEIVGFITSELDVVNDTAQFVHEIRVAIESHGYTQDELIIIDEAFMANGIDVAPICRSKHPS